MELDVGELRHPIDGQEHDQFAVGVTQFTTVDVDVADLVGLEPLAALLCLLDWKPGDAMALQAAVQGAAAEIGYGVLQATKHIVQGQQSLLPERNHDGFHGRRQHPCGLVTRTLARIRLSGKMAHDDLVCPPSVSACDHPARRLALCAFHAQLSRRRRSARRAWAGCLLRNGAKPVALSAQSSALV